MNGGKHVRRPEGVGNTTRPPIYSNPFLSMKVKKRENVQLISAGYSTVNIKSQGVEGNEGLCPYAALLDGAFRGICFFGDATHWPVHPEPKRRLSNIALG